MGKMYISKCDKYFYEETFSDDREFYNYLDLEPMFEKPTTDVIENVKVCIYTYDKPFTLEQAQNSIIDKYFGTMCVESEEYGYSEYTIEGFNVLSLEIGGHDLINILNSNNKYKIITIEKIK